MRADVLLGLCVLATLGLSIGCGGADQATSGAGDNATSKSGAEVIAQKTCPVMRGNSINPTIYRDYKGRRIYFCCDLCPPTFDRDPEKYLKIVDEELRKAAPAPKQQ